MDGAWNISHFAVQKFLPDHKEKDFVPLTSMITTLFMQWKSGCFILLIGQMRSNTHSNQPFCYLKALIVMNIFLYNSKHSLHKEDYFGQKRDI